MRAPFLSLLLLAASNLSGQIWVEPPSGATLAVYGGEKARLNLLVVSKSPGSVGVSCNLYQIAGSSDGLGVPLETGKVLGVPIEFGPEVLRTATVDLAVPAVQRPTRMVAQFFPSHAAGPEASGHSQIALSVFPKPRPGEWAEALASAEKNSGRILAVFGKSPGLRNFLTEQKIGFLDLGDEYPREFPASQLVVGEVSAEAFEKQRPRAAGGSKIFFVGGAAEPPGIYETVDPSGSLTKVTLPIPEGLAADPQCQSAFITLLLRQLNPTSYEN